MSVTRRVFVAGAGAIFGAVSVSGAVLLTGIPVREWLQWRIAHEVVGVPFAAGTVDSFVDAFLAVERPDRAYRLTSAELVTKVLLSTDFFETGGAKPARFVALFGEGCRNPLARFD